MGESHSLWRGSCPFSGCCSLCSSTCNYYAIGSSTTSGQGILKVYSNIKMQLLVLVSRLQKHLPSTAECSVPVSLQLWQNDIKPREDARCSPLSLPAPLQCVWRNHHSQQWLPSLVMWKALFQSLHSTLRAAQGEVPFPLNRWGS
jgi:hypothetical protein